MKRRTAFAAAVAASVLALDRARATVYTYTPNSGTSDLWSTGADWSAVPVSATTTELTFVGANATVLPVGLVNTNTNNISGAFQLNILDLQGTGPATGTADTIKIASVSPSTGLSFAANGSTGPIINLNALSGVAGLSYNITAPIAVTSNPLVVQGAGTASFQFSGGLTTTAASFYKEGTSSLTLAGATSIANNLVIGEDTSGNGNNSGTLTIASGGTLSVGSGTSNNMLVGGNTSSSNNAYSAVLDLTSAASFTANVNNFGIDYSTAATPVTANGTVKLGALSNITAAADFRVGEHDNAISGNGSGGLLTIAPNGIANIKTANFLEEYNKTSATVTLGAGAAFNLSGATTGARAVMQIGNSTSTTVSSTSGLFDASASGATVNIYGTFLLIASDNQSGAGNVSSSMLISSSNLNHLDLSNTTTTSLGVVTVGRQAQGSGIATGTLTIGGLDNTSSIVATDNGPGILVGTSNGSSKAVGTVNLNGTGVLTITTTGRAISGNIQVGTGTSTVNFNGLTIKAGASTAASSQWITGLTNANIGDNGAVFDTGVYNVNTNQVFQHGTGLNAIDGGVTKLGAGTLTMSGASTYNGSTNVNAGTLAVSGSVTSTINVNNTATLNLAGSTTSSVNAYNGSTVSGEGTAGGTLTFNGSDALMFDPTTAGSLTAGAVNASSGTVVVTPGSSLVGNGLVVLSAAGGISGAIGTNFTAATRGSLYFDNPAAPTQLLFNSSSAASLVWQGSDPTNPSYWDLRTTANFNNNGVTDVFYNGDSVLLDDTASSFVVNVQGTVQPGSVTFNNTAHNFTLQGGVIGGSTSLAMNGAGTVIVTSSNTYTGGTTIASGGTIQLGDGTVLTGSLGTGTIAINGSLVTDFGPGSVTLPNLLTGSGSLIQEGASTLHIAVANPSFTGTTNISGGALQLDGAGTLGSSSIIDDASFIANASMNLSNTISGTGNVTVTSAYTLTLLGSNTYTGNTVIPTGATVSVGNGGTAGSIGGGTILDSGTLVLNRTDSSVVGANINGSGAVIMNATGTFTLSGVNTVGSMTIGSNVAAGSIVVPSGASLSLGSNSATGSLTIGYAPAAIPSSGTLDASAASNFTTNLQYIILGSAQGSGVGTASGTLKLPASGSITVGTAISIGNSNGTYSGTSSISTANGSGTVSFFTPLIQDGYEKNHGIFTVGAGDTVTIAGIANGPSTALYVGHYVIGGGTGFWSGLFDGSAGNVSATLSGLYIGNRNGGSGLATMDGQFILSNSPTNHLSITGATTGPALTAGAAGLVTVGTMNSGDTLGAATGTLTIGNLDSTSSITTTDGGTAILVGAEGANSNAPATGVVNLNGGRLLINSTGTAIKGGTGFSTLNLNGATLAAGESNANFISNLTAVNIRNGGVTFDTGSYNVSIGQMLSHSADGTIGAVSVSNGGSDYTTAPAVAITGGNVGSTGSATAIIFGGVVTGVVLNNVQNFATAPTLTFNGGGGSGATATVAYTPDNAIDGGLTKVGTGMLTLGGSNTYTGGTNVSAGTIVATNNSALGTGAVSLSNGTTLSIGLNTTGGAVALANAVNVGPSASALVQLAPTSAFTKGTVGAISVGSSGELSVVSPTVAGVTHGVLIATSVSAAASTVDVGRNDLDLTGQSVGDVTALVKSGFNGGAWNGSGIVSSAAANDPQHLTALGVIANGTTFTTNTFDGITPAATDTLVKYTYYGDANLDGQVDGSDYTLVDNGFNNQLTGWQNGDFNYDGVIDGSDYTLIDNAFNTQGASLAAQVQSLNAVATDQIAGGAAVPEPTALGMIMMAAGGLLSRRKRRDR